MKVYKFSKLKMIWCYYLRFQLSFLAIALVMVLAGRFVLKGLILGILLTIPISLFFVFLHYWKLLFHPREVELWPDKLVFKWKNKQKSIKISEIRKITIDNFEVATYPVNIILHLSNGEKFVISAACLWGAGEFLEDMEKHGIKITRNTRVKIKNKKTGKVF